MPGMLIEGKWTNEWKERNPMHWRLNQWIV
jgi:hypothetical protein